jgi:hypothetical protein
MSSKHKRVPHWSSVTFWVRFLSKIPGGYEINTSGATSNIESDYKFLMRIWDNYEYNLQTTPAEEVEAVEPLTVLGR